MWEGGENGEGHLRRHFGLFSAVRQEEIVFLFLFISFIIRFFFDAGEPKRWRRKKRMKRCKRREKLRVFFPHPGARNLLVQREMLSTFIVIFINSIMIDCNRSNLTIADLERPKLPKKLIQIEQNHQISDLH